MEQRAKSRFDGLAAPGLQRTPSERPPELPRTHVNEVSGNDLPKTPRWKKFLSGLFRTAPLIVPGGGALYAAAQVQVIDPTVSVTDSAQVDRLVQVLVVIVPQENTPAKLAETRSFLREAFDYLFGDAVKDAVKLTVVGAPLFALATFLRKRAKESGNQSIAWVADAADKLAGLFGKNAAGAGITTESIASAFGDKAGAAEILLLALGYTKDGTSWRKSA